MSVPKSEEYHKMEQIVAPFFQYDMPDNFSLITSARRIPTTNQLQIYRIYSKCISCNKPMLSEKDLKLLMMHMPKEGSYFCDACQIKIREIECKYLYSKPSKERDAYVQVWSDYMFERHQHMRFKY